MNHINFYQRSEEHAPSSELLAPHPNPPNATDNQMALTEAIVEFESLR